MLVYIKYNITEKGALLTTPQTDYASQLLALWCSIQLSAGKQYKNANRENMDNPILHTAVNFLFFHNQTWWNIRKVQMEHYPVRCALGWLCQWTGEEDLCERRRRQWFHSSRVWWPCTGCSWAMVGNKCSWQWKPSPACLQKVRNTYCYFNVCTDT